MNETLLLWINQGWAHPWLDVFFGWVSDRETFAYPLVVVILAISLLQKGRKGVGIWLLLLLTVGVGDATGAWLKDLIGQPRPCLDLWEAVRRPGKLVAEPCSRGTDGMPSNHSINFFVMASFMGLVMRSWVWGTVMGGVAVLVGVSRIYLGVHYPLQVLAGAGIGSFLGSLSGGLAGRYLAGSHEDGHPADSQGLEGERDP